MRSNEARNAVWGEFDLDSAIWTIPAARMKMKEAHLVPLAPATLELMKSLRHRHVELYGKVATSDPIFSLYCVKPISDVTMLKALRDMNEETVTVHGFRSTFTDWVAECTDVPKEVADKALAHKVANAVEAAYRSTDFFDRRRLLMAEWADFLLRG